MWTKDNILELISLLKFHRCLWDPAVKNRKNKSIKSEAYTTIAKKLNINMNEVKKKIDALRSQMSVEHMKVNKNDQPGSKPKVSKWEFYNELLFLYKEKESSGVLLESSAPDQFSELTRQFGKNPLVSEYLLNNIAPLLDPAFKENENPADILDAIKDLMSQIKNADMNLVAELSVKLQKMLNKFENLCDGKEVPVVNCDEEF